MSCRIHIESLSLNCKVVERFTLLFMHKSRTLARGRTISSTLHNYFNAILWKWLTDKILNKSSYVMPWSVQVLMATNRIDILDAALLRPGRIDRKIEFPNPNESSRFDILKIHSRKMNLVRGINLKTVADKMTGASGAEMKVNTFLGCQLCEVWSFHIFGDEQRSMLLNYEKMNIYSNHKTFPCLLACQGCWNTVTLQNTDAVSHSRSIKQLNLLRDCHHVCSRDTHMIENSCSALLTYTLLAYSKKNNQERNLGCKLTRCPSSCICTAVASHLNTQFTSYFDVPAGLLHWSWNVCSSRKESSCDTRRFWNGSCQSHEEGQWEGCFTEEAVELISGSEQKCTLSCIWYKIWLRWITIVANTLSSICISDILAVHSSLVLEPFLTVQSDLLCIRGPL